MAEIILVPGMWHGAWCWQRLEPYLKSAGHSVRTVTLTGAGELARLYHQNISLYIHIDDIVRRIIDNDIYGVILVGHSLAGTIAPAVAELIPERLSCLVNLDGPLPQEGKAIKDLLPDYYQNFRQRGRDHGDEWRTPPPDWDFGVSGSDLEWLRANLTSYPLKTWETPFHFSSPEADAIPRYYIHCLEGLSSDEIEKEKQECLQAGWRYQALAAGHDAMISAPEALAQLLLEINHELT